ncbi:glyoxalase superfamily protein [Candidatus Nitronereus thalassa]|uniref:Bleomycin resistance protein n=1 Tax=Candidatus Nitronereus thalassa TaxID=3020898 RepID=A0ABU3KCZ6_9BACT|nr:glyoxalase superfamily protein [Candidatus Nitronereus thalassa]MDT7044037.1 glyoxalase superfamily protein [Candidatus Nitronereus thalassa]
MNLTHCAVPILRIFDVDKTREFYIDYLGFQVDWQHQFEVDTPLYMQISRDKLKLHLSEHVGDCTPGSAVFIEISNIEELHKELAAKNYKYFRPGIEIAPWNAKIMELIDPFGNKLRFTQDD